jgi:hypothetical protein
LIRTTRKKRQAAALIAPDPDAEKEEDEDN